jgi:hypothetical protein
VRRLAQSEQLRRTGGGLGGVLLSLALHASLAGLLVYGAWISNFLPLGGKTAGTAAPGAITANLVAKVPGGVVPMPSRVITPTKNRLASDIHARGITRPHHFAAPRHSVALPSYSPEKLARQEAERELRAIARADRAKKPKNRVAYGNGGRVSFPATTSQQGNAGSGGMSFGDASFGNLYTDWVNHLRDRLQYYWVQQPRDPSLPSGLQVTVSLVVERSGVIDSIHYVSRSSSVEVNQMGYDTVQQMAQHERFPLPPGYAPSSLAISVTFELTH